MKQSKYGTIHPQLLCDLDVANDLPELFLGVEKISSARTDHCKNWNVNLTADCAHQVDVRSYSAHWQVLAELDPVSSAALGGQCRVEGLDTNFQQREFLHLGELGY